MEAEVLKFQANLRPRQRKRCGEEGEGKEKVKVSKFNFFSIGDKFTDTA